MISPAAIAHWRTNVPWVSDDNVEQDLILSRLRKVSEQIFSTDLDALVVSWPEGYSVEASLDVMKRIIDEVE